MVFFNIKECNIIPATTPNCCICCNEHGTINAISSDFGDRMTTQLMRLIWLLRWSFSGFLGSSDDKEKRGVARPEGPPLRGFRYPVSGRGSRGAAPRGSQGSALKALRLNRRRAKWTHRCNHREGLRARVLHRMNRRYGSYIRRCIGRRRPRKIPTPVKPSMHRSIASVQLSREVVFGGTWRSYNHRLNRR